MMSVVRWRRVPRDRGTTRDDLLSCRVTIVAKIADVRAAGNMPEFDRAALDTVRRWQMIQLPSHVRSWRTSGLC